MTLTSQLVCHSLIGEVIAYRSGHELNRQLVEKLYEEDAIQRLPLAEITGGPQWKAEPVPMVAQS